MDTVKKENIIVSAYKRVNSWLSENFGIAGRKAVLSSLALVGIFIFFGAYLGENFLNAKNFSNLLQQIVTYAIIGFGLTFTLICGGTDLSAGASMALSGIIVLSLLNAGVAWPIAFAVVIVAGVMVGIVNGFTIEVLGIVPFIATLGTQWVFRGLAGIITNGFPVYTSSIKNESLRIFFESIGSGRINLIAGFAIPYSVILMAIYGTIMGIILSKTRVGRQIYAVGSNPEAARLSGINTVRTRMFAYCMSGISAAICGIVVTSRLQSAQPTAGTGVELEAIAAAVVGGVSNNGGEGNIVNTIIGALIMGTMKNGLNIAKVNAYYQQVVIGLILVGACALEAYRHRKQG